MPSSRSAAWPPELIAERPAPRAGGSAAAPSGPATVSVAQLGAVLAAAAALVVLARGLELERVAVAEEFALIFASIVIEALPFILAGALVSALLATYVPDRVFARIGRLPAGVQVPGAMACAFAFPVCECGSVPVARRLISRGLHPAAGLAFMLAAPVVNPIVLASTWVAYSGSGQSAPMTLARAATGIAVAAAAALLIGRRTVLRGALEPPACSSDGAPRGRLGRAGHVADHLAGDFVFMGKFVALGAAVAALIQIGIPQHVLTGLGEVPVLGPLVMMALALSLALCSEADAFVAVSLSGVGLGSQLAFLALGPVVDVKLAILYAAVFGRGFTVRLVTVAVPVILVAVLVFEVVAA